MKTQRRRTILAVDDDEINLMILVKSAQDAGFAVKSFSASEAAWQYLNDHPDQVDIALLDKMMPDVSGLELLRRIKSSKSLRHMPVILQTGDVGVSQMREGLESGAYYYLTKPFHPEILSAILHSASQECATREEMFAEMAAGQARVMGLLQLGEFLIRSHDEARTFAATISQAATYPEFVALGLMELLSNSIEHGNLEIGYDQKRKCLLAGTWDQELKTRSDSAVYSSRFVRVHVEKMPTGMRLAIIDEGKGFDWRPYMYDESGPNHFNEPNGRGIAKSTIMLDEVRYVGKGNEVHCHVAMPTSVLTLSDRGAAAAAHS